MVRLVKLSSEDSQEIYEMLKGIDLIENSYTNPVHDMTIEEFKTWLSKQLDWDRGENLPEGYVQQSIYWLYDDNTPIGMGKIRHGLTNVSRENGGNIGYGISKPYRNRGYGVVFLKLLLIEARKMKLDEILLTVDKCNVPSKRICEENGGILFKETTERLYYSFNPGVGYRSDAPERQKLE